jgi:hypothetical protein
MQANYRVVKGTEAYLLLEDLGPWHKYATITNAAEEVVAAMLPQLGNRRLLYYDSEGELTELLIKAERFAGFAPGKLED